MAERVPGVPGVPKVQGSRFVGSVRVWEVRYNPPQQARRSLDGARFASFVEEESPNSAGQCAG